LIRLITLILGLSALASCADKPKNLIQAICTDDAKAVRSELSNGASPNQFADTNDKNMLPLFIATDIFSVSIRHQFTKKRLSQRSLSTGLMSI
jgi:hypothetical protein